jgi:O-antigen ligase
LISFLIPLWWLAIIWTYTEAFPRPFDDWKNGLLYIGVGIFFGVGWVKRRKSGLSLTPALSSWERGILVLYFLICIVSILFSPTGRYEGLLELARLILWCGGAWVFAQLTPRHWLWLMRITVISAALIAVLTWFQSRGITIWPYSGVFLAPIGHISYYGDFMALSWVMAAGLLFLDPRYPLKSAVGMTSLICMFLIDIGLALSATRASLVGMIAALLLAIPLSYTTSRSFKNAIILFLVGALNLAVIFAFPVKSIRGESAGNRLLQSTTLSVKLSHESLDTASSGRWHTYITSLKITDRRPTTGWGLGSFRFVYPEFAHRDKQDEQVSSATWYYHPHNEILHQAIEVGWLGAMLFVVGFGYLLYSGIRTLRHTRGDEQILIITAICGLVAAFVSWQFSTNFLFPVSRLMTALFVGMIWKSKSNSPRPPLILRGGVGVIALSTLLLLANQAGLYCVQKEQITADPRDKWHWATWAVRLAPGAFDPLYVRASVALQTLPPAQAAPDVEALYNRYPYVPAVLQMIGYLRAQQGNIPEARKHLQHAVANDPANAGAKQLLDQLPPAH